MTSSGRCLVDDSIALKDRGQLEQALAVLDQAIEEGHDVARAWYQKGLTLVALERAADAAVAYRQAIAARPDYLKALVNLAGLHLRDGDTAPAADLLRRAEALAPADDAVFLCTRAALRRQQHDAAGAIADARRAAELAPAEAGAWEELGVSLLLDPRAATASAAASQRALLLDPSRIMAAHNLAVALDRAGEPDEALGHATAALEARPDDPTLAQTKACILLHLDRPAAAMPLLQQVLRARPHHFEAHYNLACALAKTGHLDEAVDHVAHALAAVPPAQQLAFRAHVPRDPDLAALRSHPGFQRLIG